MADQLFTMTTTDFDALKRELERQNRQLAEVEQALGAFDFIDVPKSFFAELDEACEPPVARPSSTSTSFFLHSLRA